jgi:hypothetical protein
MDTNIPNNHIDANYIDDTYMLHNDTYTYGESNPILSIGAIFILICSSICCSYRPDQYFMRGFLNSDNINNSYSIKENIIKSDKLRHYKYDTTLLDTFNKDCSICLDNFEDNDKTVVLDCNHRFHRDCILNWFKKELNCPLCRKNIEL